MSKCSSSAKLRKGAGLLPGWKNFKKMGRRGRAKEDVVGC